MPSITFDKFGKGIDRRRGISVSDSDALIDMTNTYITNGKGIARRGGAKLVGTLSLGSVGLVSYDGNLCTFSGAANPVHGTADGVTLKNYQLLLNSDNNIEASKTHYAESYDGFLYAAIEYENDEVQHSYVDTVTGPPYHVSDVNCPHTKGLIKVQSKIYATDGEQVRYTSSQNGPTDWTAANDAGFLATGRQAPGTTEALALGEFAGRLMVFMRDAGQIWVADPDPNNIILEKTLRNVGTDYPLSLAPVSGDLFFLSSVGYRSVAKQRYTDSLEDYDVGTPIDSIVTPLLVDGIQPIATYFAGKGQYMCIIGDVMHVYSFSQSAKVSAWSKFKFNFPIDAMASLGDELYLRSGDKVYKLDDDYDYDEQTAFDWDIRLAYQSNKAPGIEKQFYGADVVCEGVGELQHAYDPRDQNKVTAGIEISGNTRPAALLPVEVISSEIGPVIKGTSSDGAFRLDAISYYYNHVGAHV